jgi:flavorubredoxin
MGRFLVVCASRTDQTRHIGDLIAEGIRMAGHEAVVKMVGEIKNEESLKGYDGYAFGSPTYHGDMIQSMKQLLFIAERAELENKAGAAFGAYGWSGESAERIFNTMSIIFKMKMVSSPLMLKASWVEGGMRMAQDYGKELASLG